MNTLVYKLFQHIFFFNLKLLTLKLFNVISNSLNNIHKWKWRKSSFMSMNWLVNWKSIKMSKSLHFRRKLHMSSTQIQFNVSLILRIAQLIRKMKHFWKDSKKCNDVLIWRSQTSRKEHEIFNIQSIAIYYQFHDTEKNILHQTIHMFIYTGNNNKLLHTYFINMSSNSLW